MHPHTLPSDSDGSGSLHTRNDEHQELTESHELPQTAYRHQGITRPRHYKHPKLGGRWTGILRCARFLFTGTGLAILIFVQRISSPMELSLSISLVSSAATYFMHEKD